MTRQEEHEFASFFARPEWAHVRQLLEQLTPGSTAPIDALIRRVRVEQWRDFSQR